MANKNTLKGVASKMLSHSEEATPEVKEVVEPIRTDEAKVELSSEDLEKLKSLAEVFTQEKRRRGRPTKSEEQKKNSPDERTSVIIDKIQLAKVREIAYKEKLTQKQIFYLALGRLIDTYEEKHGTITPTVHAEHEDINNIF